MGVFNEQSVIYRSISLLRQNSVRTVHGYRFNLPASDIPDDLLPFWIEQENGEPAVPLKKGTNEIDLENELCAPCQLFQYAYGIYYNRRPLIGLDDLDAHRTFYYWQNILRIVHWARTNNHPIQDVEPFDFDDYDRIIILLWDALPYDKDCSFPTI